MEKEELIPYGFKVPKSISDKIVALADKRKVKYSIILNEAVVEYFERKENPDLLKEQMKQALRDDPTILKDTLGDLVREQVQAQLRQTLGKINRS